MRTNLPRWLYYGYEPGGLFPFLSECRMPPASASASPIPSCPNPTQPARSFLRLHNTLIVLSSPPLDVSFCGAAFCAEPWIGNLAMLRQGDWIAAVWIAAIMGVVAAGHCVLPRPIQGDDEFLPKLDGDWSWSTSGLVGLAGGSSIVLGGIISRPWL